MIEHARSADAMEPNTLPRTKTVLKFFEDVRSIFPGFHGEGILLVAERGTLGLQGEWMPSNRAELVVRVWVQVVIEVECERPYAIAVHEVVVHFRDRCPRIEIAVVGG